MQKLHRIKDIPLLLTPFHKITGLLQGFEIMINTSHISNPRHNITSFLLFFKGLVKYPDST